MLEEYIPGQTWLCAYPIKYAGTRFDARMPLIRLRDGKLMLYSPCETGETLKRATPRSTAGLG